MVTGSHRFGSLHYLTFHGVVLFNFEVAFEVAELCFHHHFGIGNVARQRAVGVSSITPFEPLPLVVHRSVLHNSQALLYYLMPECSMLSTKNRWAKMNRTSSG